MLRYYFINKRWMVSATARRSYRVAASLSLAPFFFLFFIAVAVQLVTIPEAAIRDNMARVIGNCRSNLPDVRLSYHKGSCMLGWPDCS